MNRTPSFAVPALLGFLVLMATDVAAQVRTTTLPTDDKRIRIPMEQVFSVGRADGASWETLSGVSSVAFDASDNLHLLDRGNSRVLVFGPDGRFLRQIGRPGSGPGELRNPIQMAVAADGSVVVADVGAQTMVVFDREGTYQRSLPLPRQLGVISGPITANPRDGVIFAGLAVPGTESTRDQLIWQPLRGEARVLYRSPEDPAGAGARSDGSVRVVSFQRPVFSPTLRWTVLPSGRLAVVGGTGYRVEVIGADGAPQHVLVRDVRPREVTDADRERERERRMRALSGGGAAVTGGEVSPLVRAALQAQMREMSFASVVPVIREIRADAEGRIWVEHTPSGSEASGRVDVIGPTGGYVGTLARQEMPDAFSRDGLAAYVTTDELGVERVVVYRLPEGWYR